MAEILATIFKSFICITITSAIAIGIFILLVCIFTPIYQEISDWYERKNHEKEQWQKVIDYCRNDVIATKAFFKRYNRRKNHEKEQ